MKKIIKLSAIALSFILLVAAACVPFGAVTILESNGFQYSVVSATTADLHGRLTDDANLVIPKDFSDRYVVNIVDSAFQGDQNIETLSFSKAILLERIGFYAFKDCSNLSGQITFGGRINTLGYSAFEGCSSLESVSFKSYIATVPDQCFYNCSSLSNVSLNERVTAISKFAFASCPSLEYIEIPKSVTSINETAFNGDENLTLGVYFGSYAHQFAKDNGISYTLLDYVTTGDADSNGSVNINDVTAIQRHVAEFESLNELQLKAADVNHDGKISVEDATVIQRFLAEYEEALN